MAANAINALINGISFESLPAKVPALALVTIIALPKPLIPAVAGASESFAIARLAPTIAFEKIGIARFKLPITAANLSRLPIAPALSTINLIPVPIPFSNTIKDGPDSLIALISFS